MSTRRIETVHTHAQGRGSRRRDALLFCAAFAVAGCATWSLDPPDDMTEAAALAILEQHAGDGKSFQEVTAEAVVRIDGPSRASGDAGDAGAEGSRTTYYYARMPEVEVNWLPGLSLFTVGIFGPNAWNLSAAEGGNDVVDEVVRDCNSSHFWTGLIPGWLLLPFLWHECDATAVAEALMFLRAHAPAPPAIEEPGPVVAQPEPAPPAPPAPPKLLEPERALEPDEVVALALEVADRLRPFELADILGPDDFVPGAGSSTMTTSERKEREDGITTTLMVSRHNGERPFATALLHKVGTVSSYDAFFGERGETVATLAGPADVAELVPFGYTRVSLFDPAEGLERRYAFDGERWTVSVFEVPPPGSDR